MEVLGNLALVLQLLIFRPIEVLDPLLNALKKVSLIEDIRHDEVEQRPQFLEVIVERRASEQQTEGGLEVVDALEIL
jgi:hypothetical protein